MDADTNLIDVDTLRTAVLSNDATRTKDWFESKSFCTNNHGETITKIRCSGRNELVNLLVEAITTHNDDAFNTMLQYTCHTSVLYHARNIDDQLLSQVVLSKGSVSCLMQLIHCGHDINYTDSDGMTPLLYLVYKKSVSRVKKYTEKLQFLLQHGADVNKQGSQNWAFAPLHIAVLYSCGIQTVRTLIEAGADVSLQCNSSLSTPLFFAIENGAVELVDLLLQHGADPSIVDVLGDTPLHAAILQDSKWSSLIKVFVKWNISLEIQNTNGQLPLMWALENWKTVRKSRIQSLLKAGAKCTNSEWLKIREGESVDTKLEHKLSEIENMLEVYAFRPRTLHELACFRIRNILGNDLPRLVPLLPLPDCLKRRVNLEHYFGKTI